MTYVLCPVGLRIVKPGYVPPYVHMLVHGPSRTCTHASSIPIETFAFVFTGGNTKGRENGDGVAVAVGVGVAVIPRRVASAESRPVPRNPAAKAKISDTLESILLRNSTPELFITHHVTPVANGIRHLALLRRKRRCYGRGAGVGRARGVGVTLGPSMY